MAAPSGALFYLPGAVSKGAWITSGFQAGDILLFDFNSNGTADHVEFVVAVGPGTITTIGGNTTPTGGGAEGVWKKTRPLIGSHILGAFRPAYGLAENVPAPPAETPPAPSPQAPANEGDLADVVTAVIRGNFGNGEERRQRLAAAGYDYSIVQSLVNARLAAAGNT